MVRAIAFSIDFIVRVRPMFITGFMRATILQMITRTRAIWIVLLRRLGVAARRFLYGMVPYYQVILISVCAFRFRQLSISRWTGVQFTIDDLLFG